MNRKSTLKILGYEHKVIFLDKEASGDDAGWFNRYYQSITIDKGQSWEQQQSTLIHEVIEAINSHLDLGLSHQQISALEIGVYSFIRDNGVDITLLLQE